MPNASSCASQGGSGAGSCRAAGAASAGDDSPRPLPAAWPLPWPLLSFHQRSMTSSGPRMDHLTRLDRFLDGNVGLLTFSPVPAARTLQEFRNARRDEIRLFGERIVAASGHEQELAADDLA